MRWVSLTAAIVLFLAASYTGVVSARTPILTLVESQEKVPWSTLSGFQSGNLAGHFKFLPVSPCGDASLLFFTSPLGEGRARREQHYVFDPREWTKPQMFLDSDLPIAIEARLDNRTVLFSAHAPGQLYLLDLETARWKRIPSSERAEFVGATESAVYYLGTVRRGDPGYVLEGSDKPIVVAEPHPVQWLHAIYSTDKGADRLLLDKPVHRIVTETNNEFLVATALPESELWWVSKKQLSNRRLAKVGDDWLVGELTAAVSPDGRRVALGVAHKGDFFGNRDLLILDSQSGERLYENTEIPVRVSHFSSSSPDLEFFWLDGEHVRWSQSELTEELDPQFPTDPKYLVPREGFFRWQDLDLTTGRIEDRGRYAILGLSHEKPSQSLIRPDPAKIRRGHFEIVDYQASLPGVAQTFPDLRARSVSPEGDFGFIDGAQLQLVDGATGQSEAISERWTYAQGWNRAALVGW